MEAQLAWDTDDTRHMNMKINKHLQQLRQLSVWRLGWTDFRMPEWIIHPLRLCSIDIEIPFSLFFAACSSRWFASLRLSAFIKAPWIIYGIVLGLGSSLASRRVWVLLNKVLNWVHKWEHVLFILYWLTTAHKANCSQVTTTFWNLRLNTNILPNISKCEYCPVLYYFYFKKQFNLQHMLQFHTCNTSQ